MPYFDIPLQHVAPSVLRGMRRPGSADSYLKLVRSIRERNPLAAIRTTFIVGFPGETEEDFELLLEFVQQARLDRLSVFRYWPEAGTAAADMPGQVPMELADERLDELMQVQEDISLDINRAFVGRQLQVLVEEQPEGSNLWLGRSFRDAPEVDGQVKIEAPCGAEPKPGQFVSVEITAAEVHDIRGRIVSACSGI